jgi:TusA-related sulfurtransferase
MMERLPLNADQALDLSEKGCGQLVMELMFAMNSLESGQTLLVTAYDPSAAEDITAWCRMTGNILIQPIPESNSSDHQFLVQKGP